MKKVPPGEAAHFFSGARMAPKSVTDLTKGCAQTQTHNPIKWAPVFGQDHARTKMFDGRNRS